MAQLSFAEGLQLLETRTRWAVIAIWSVIAVALATTLGELLEIAGYADVNAPEPGGLTMLVGLVYICFVLFYLISIVFVSMWIHRAHANLFAAGVDELEFTPGWSVGWFFVPIANLFKPFQAMRELWNASYGNADSFGGETPGTVSAWWGCLIVANILSNIGSRVGLNATDRQGQIIGLSLEAAGTVLTIAAAWFLLIIIREVMEGQRNHLQISEAFA